MWRDRTNLYISYRQSYAHHPASKKPKYGSGINTSNGFADDERRGLMAGLDEDEGDAVIEMDLLPPRWLDVQDEVTEYLAEIAGKTRQLEQLHQKHVLPGFDDEDVKKREEREIERMTQEITRGFQACQKSIQRIDMMVRDSHHSGGGVSRSEEVMARNLKTSLAARTGDASALFRKKQSAYLKKLRTMGGMASPTLGSRSGTPSQNPYSDPSMEESESDRALSQSALLQTAQRRSHAQNANEALISQREHEIEQIAQGVIELANIFQELQTMVIDQGSMLDRIDYNVERMATEVKEADKELRVATGYQKRTVKRKVMLLLAICIAAVVILLGLKLGSRGSSSAPPPPPAPPKNNKPNGGGGGNGGGGNSNNSPRGLFGDQNHIRRRNEWRRRRRRVWEMHGRESEPVLTM